MVSHSVLRGSVDWLVAVLAGEVGTDAVEAGFAPRVVEGRDLVGGLARRFGAFREQAAHVASFEVLGPTRARAVVVCGGREWEFTVAVESDSPHRVATFQPRLVPGDAVAWPEVVERLRELDHAVSELPEGVSGLFRRRLVEAAGADRVAGLACGVVVDAEVVYQGYLGVADVRTLAPLDHGSVFRVGSVAKWVTAYAVLDLVAEGLLDLSAPLSAYAVGGWEVTVGDLLVHRAGLPRDLPGRRGEAALPATLGEAVNVLKPVGSVGSVGDRAAYSNLGYEVLGLLVEHVTGEDFAARCSRRVLARFGVVRLGNVALGGAGALAPSTVTGNEVVAGRLAPVAEPFEAYRAAGGMTADLPGVLALAGSFGRPDDPLVRALSSYRAPAGPDTRFVPGGAILSGADGPVFWRGGSTRGFTAEVVAAVDGSAAVVVLGSATPAPGLRVVAEGLLGEVCALRRSV